MAEMPEKITASTEVTLTMDMTAFLQATIGEVPSYGTSFDPEDDWQPDPVVGAIIDTAGRIVAEKLMSNETYYQGMTKRLKETIDQALADMVIAELDKPFKLVDTYGEVVRGVDPVTLRERIKEQIETTLAKGMRPGDRYAGSNAGVDGKVKEYVDKAILEVINKDFKTAIDQAKATVVKRIRDNAEQVIADTIAKGVK